MNAVKLLGNEKTIKRKRCQNGFRMHPTEKICKEFRKKFVNTPLHSPIHSPIHTPLHSPLHSPIHSPHIERPVLEPITRKYRNTTLAHNQKLRHIAQFLGDEYKTPTVNDIILGPVRM